MSKKVLLGICGVLLVGLLAMGAYTHTHKVDSTNTVSQIATANTCPHLFISWNLLNFGRSKSDDALTVMASTLKDADIVAIQEVNAGKDFGSQAIAKLVDLLTRTGSSWDYIVSDPTEPHSSGSERYAYLVKRHVAFSRDTAKLLTELAPAIDREPYMLTISIRKSDPLQLFTIHAVPTEKNPLREIEALTTSTSVSASPRAIFSGDFNLPARITDPIFERMGYQGHIREKTSLRTKLDAQHGYLRHQYDNIYTRGLTVCESGTVDFVEQHFSPVTNEMLTAARKVSDHLPVFVRFK